MRSLQESPVSSTSNGADSTDQKPCCEVVSFFMFLALLVRGSPTKWKLLGNLPFNPRKPLSYILAALTRGPRAILLVLAAVQYRPD